MIPPGQSPAPPLAQPEAAAAVAAVAQARAKLLALALQAGHVIDAKVLGPAPNGLTQLAIAGQTYNVKLPTLLPAGTMLQVQVQPGAGTAQPLLVVQPPPALTPVAAAPVISILPSTIAVATWAQALGAGVQAAPLAPAPTPAQVAVPSLTVAAAPPQPSVAPPPMAVTSPRITPSPLPNQAGPAAALPSPGVIIAPVQPPTAATALPVAIVVSSPVAPTAPGVAVPALPAAPATPATSAPAMPAASPPPAAAPTPPIFASSSPPAGAAQPASPAPSLNPAPSLQPQRSLPLSAPAAIAAVSPAPGSNASAALGLITQAAARQDSIAPLLQNLAVLQGRIGQFPRPIAEAALRLLAGRLVVGNAPPGAAGLKQAVLQSGVFARPQATPTAPTATDLRSALVSLRGALMNFVGGEIEPVAPVARRPPPPTREAQPRAMRAELPTLPEGATPREAGRALLHQADAALSRLRLLQIASQPTDAGRSGAPAAVADWTVEVPMLLGHELAVAQLRISRDAERRDPKRDRSWQLRFSVHFSILGEVGAQVGLEGKVTSIALWAAEPVTAAVLEEMLPELRPALIARGLEVGVLRVGRGVPGNAQPRAGQFMDHLK